MGSKVNPNSFRSIINEYYNSNWFYCNKFNFFKFLKEDLFIRNFLTKQLNFKFLLFDIPVINRFTGEILEINIDYFSLYTEEEFSSLRDKSLNDFKLLKKTLVIKLYNLLSNQKIFYKKIFFNFNQVDSIFFSAKLVFLLICKQLKKKLPIKRILSEISSIVSSNKKIFGLKIKVSGRLRGEDKSIVTSLNLGALSLQTLENNVNFHAGVYPTKHGSVGIKVWISF